MATTEGNVCQIVRENLTRLMVFDDEVSHVVWYGLLDDIQADSIPKFIAVFCTDLIDVFEVVLFGQVIVMVI